MTENKSETKHVSDVELEITGMKWEVTKGRLVINTDKGRITCRPKKESKQMIRGLETVETVPMTIEDLPEKVFEVMRAVNEKGAVKVKGSYQCFDADVDGVVTTYRFLNSIKQFESWAVLGLEGGNSPSPSPNPEKITVTEPNKAPRIDYEGKVGSTYSQTDKLAMSDTVVPTTPRQKAYNKFLHTEASIKEKHVLGILTEEQAQIKITEAMNEYIEASK